MQRPWTLDEIDAAHALGYDAFAARYPDRSFDAWRIKRGRTRSSGQERAFRADKALGEFDWRQANRVLRQMQELKSQASSSQDDSHFEFDVDCPIAVLCISDAHLGDWATDHELFERFTDEILQTPNLYLAILGDMVQMAVKLRSVGETSSNALPPDLQMRYLESWLEEMQPRILFSTFDNHSVEREEAAVGFSRYAEMMKRRVVYHGGIGHPTITVGRETYHLAVSHRFRGSSATNACQGGVLYLTRDGHTREIALQGDTHVPGIYKFVHGATPKMALNCGTMQLNSSYAKRWFSLFSHPVFPVFTLNPEVHQFVPYWSLDEWRRASLRGS